MKQFDAIIIGSGQSGMAVFIQTDMAVPADIEAAFKRVTKEWQSIYLLVNPAKVPSRLLPGASA